MADSNKKASSEEITGKPQWFNMKTPKAPTSYMYLLKPDTKYKKDGEYSVTIVLDPEKNPEHKQFMDDLTKKTQEVFDRNVKKIKRGAEEFRLKPLFKAEYDDKDQKTGRFSIKFSTTRPYALFGPKASDGQIPKDSLKKIWSGSTCRISAQLKEHVDTSKKTIGFVMYFDKIQFIDILSAPKDINGSSGGSSFDDEVSSTGLPSVSAPDSTNEESQGTEDSGGGNF